MSVANVGEHLCIGPISGDCGAINAVHASRRRCLLLGRVRLRGVELLVSAVLRSRAAGRVS